MRASTLGAALACGLLLAGCGGTPDHLTLDVGVGGGVYVPTDCSRLGGDEYTCTATVAGTTISGRVTITGHHVTDTAGKSRDCTEQSSTVWVCDPAVTT